MPANNEISSTERLLGLIRGEDNGVENIDTLLSNEFPDKRKARSARVWQLKKKITVGIDFGHQYLKLVKVRQVLDDQWNLLDYRNIPLDPRIPKDSPEFTRFFRATLTGFCGSPGKCKLWSTITSDQIEIRHILIPKVPKKKISNAVYWTLQKEVPFDKNDTIYDFEILGDKLKGGIPKTAVLAYIVPKQEVQQIISLFTRCGFLLTGLSLPPFAIANLLRTGLIKNNNESVCSLYVGRNYSCIDIFSSGNLALTRRIKTGMHSMIEGIIEKMKESQNRVSHKVPEGEDGSGPLTTDEQTPINMKQAERIFFSISEDFPPLSENEPGFYLKKTEIGRMLLTALNRLVGQIERTFEYYSLSSENNSVSRIYTVGEINSFKRLVHYIFERVGVPCYTVDLLASGIPFEGKVLPPDSIFESSSFTPAVGMAVSHDSRTPNLLFTNIYKEKKTSIKRINTGIFMVFLAIMTICMGIFLWQDNIGEVKKSEIALLTKKLEQYFPRMDQEFIVQLKEKTKQKTSTLKEYGKKYLAIAVIGELSRMTPSNIRLLGIQLRLGKIPVDDKKKAPPKNLVLEGMVFGSHQKLETSLASYLLRLANSPLFSQPTIHKSTPGYYKDKRALQFTVYIKLF